MFSDYVNALRALANLLPGAFVPLSMFILVFWIAGKLFRAWILSGHWALLLFASLFLYTLAAQMAREEQYILALVFAGPLLYLGAVTYRKLIK